MSAADPTGAQGSGDLYPPPPPFYLLYGASPCSDDDDIESVGHQGSVATKVENKVQEQEHLGGEVVAAAREQQQQGPEHSMINPDLLLPPPVLEGDYVKFGRPETSKFIKWDLPVPKLYTEQRVAQNGKQMEICKRMITRKTKLSNNSEMTIERNH